MAETRLAERAAGRRLDHRVVRAGSGGPLTPEEDLALPRRRIQNLDPQPHRRHHYGEADLAAPHETATWDGQVAATRPICTRHSAGPCSRYSQLICSGSSASSW